MLQHAGQDFPSKVRQCATRPLAFERGGSRPAILLADRLYRLIKVSALERSLGGRVYISPNFGG